MLLVACALAVLVQPALAKGWPTPAAGDSESGDPELVLTFDDGPNPKTTPAVLDALAKHHLHVIFFQVGEMVGNKNKRVAEIEARIVREGHIIGNHTMTHQDLCKTKKVSDDRAAQRDRRVAQHDRAGRGHPAGMVSRAVRRALRAGREAARRSRPRPLPLGSRSAGVEAQRSGQGRQVRRGRAVAHVRSQRAAHARHQDRDGQGAARDPRLDRRENVRRVAAHKRPIRIIQGYELAAERLPEGLVDWLRDAAPDLHALADATASTLP